MPFFGFGNGPYMAWPKKFKEFDRQIFDQATYQVVPSPKGIPMVQLDLVFSRLDSGGKPVRSIWGQPARYLTSMDWAPNVANPDMSVVVLMDISGSMLETWREGHVSDVCQTILNYTLSAGQGYDLILYSTHPTECGHIKDQNKLLGIIAKHAPMGGTSITEALRLAITKYKHKKGLYIVVVTDGEFADKQQAQTLIIEELLPQLSPENPYAFRLHFVGHGHGVDHAFLNGLEQLAAGKGVQMVTHHHHAHLSHSHGGILDELDRAFIGRTNQFSIGESKPSAGNEVITRIGELSAMEWRDGNHATFDFMPARAMVGLEFLPNHPPAVAISINMGEKTYQNISLNVPLPASTTAGAETAGASNWVDSFKLAFSGGNPDERAAEEARKQQAAIIREAEIQRQKVDLKELAAGGLPVQAKERLTELAQRHVDGEASFTSDLAPDELALLRRCGFQPRGLVTGSAMYHVGQAYASSTNDCEVRVLSDAYDQAFALAIRRMKQELQLIGAHGVVGVRINLVRHEWSDQSIEVQAVGTAVAGPADYVTTPWTSDLSGQEWYALWQAGYEPADLVYGHCAWFVLTTFNDEMIEQGTGWSQFGNMEMGHWSQALSSARHLAMNHVHKQAQAAGGCGVVGVKIARKLSEIRLTGTDKNPAYEREHHNLLVSIIGTAIRVRKNAPEKVRAATYALSLRDGRLKPMVVKQLADLKIE